MKSHILGPHEVGSYSSKEWISESRIHMRSAEILRNSGRDRYKEFECLNNKIKQESNAKLKSKALELYEEKEAAFKSSILLVGYGIELALKSGVINLYRGIPKEIALNQLKKKYGHNLDQMVMDLDIPVSKDEIKCLQALKQQVIELARYPITPNNEESFSSEWNTNTQFLQGDDFYNQLREIYLKITNFVNEIDRTNKNPTIAYHFNMDDTGYFAYRSGGNLKPRITVKYSDKQKLEGKDNIAILKDLIEFNASEQVKLQIILNDWDVLEKFEIFSVDSIKKT